MTVGFRSKSRWVGVREIVGRCELVEEVVEMEEVVGIRSISWEGWRGMGEWMGDSIGNLSGEASRSARIISRSASFMFVVCGCEQLIVVVVVFILDVISRYGDKLIRS